MTANWTKGRQSRYPYYVCRHRGCEKFGKSVARAKVEDAFESLLRALTPSPELITLFSSLFRKRWDERAAASKEERTLLKREAGEVEKKIGILLDRIVSSDNETVVSAYERKEGELERDKALLAEKTARCGMVAKDYDATFQTAVDFLSSPCNI